MIFYPNQSTNRLTRAIGLPSEVKAATFKARDTVTLDVVFHDGSAAVALAGGADLVFAIKTGFASGASTLALATVWEIVAPGHYRSKINLNNEPLVTAIGDLAKLSAVAEISWNEGDGWESSNTLAVTIENDVYKGIEGTPLELPSPLDWLELHRPAPLILTGPPENDLMDVSGAMTFDGDPLVFTGLKRVRGSVSHFTTSGLSARPATGEWSELVNQGAENGGWELLKWIDDELYCGFSSGDPGPLEDVDWTGTAIVTAGSPTGTPIINYILGTEAGGLGQLALVTMAGSGRRATFRAIQLNPVIWESATPGVQYNATLEQWRVAVISGVDGEESVTWTAL